MSASTRYWERMLRIVCGCGLVVVGAWGSVWSVRAATAQTLYKQTKYGLLMGTRFERAPQTDATTVLRSCEWAHRLYPRDYYFPVYASIRALTDALSASDPEAFRRLFGTAEHWNRQALALNPYNLESQHVACRLLQEKGDMAGAIAFWRDQVLEREFWNPDRHETLVELLLKAGETTQAIAAARWLRWGPTLAKIRVIEKRREALRAASKND